VDDESEKAIIRGKATEALLRGSYRTALPTPGRWLLAEKVVPGRTHPVTGEVSE